MKKISSLLVALAISMAFFVTSCQKTDEPVPSNPNSANSFAGNWYNSENSSVNGQASYNVKIETPDLSSIVFSYLYGFKTSIHGTVVNNGFTIPTQTVEGTSVSGSGTLMNPGRINMTYLVFDGLNTDSVTVVLTK